MRAHKFAFSLVFLALVLGASMSLRAAPTADSAGEGSLFVYLPLVHTEAVVGTTTRVSVASDGTEADFYSWSPSISADGRYVAFYSPATNLVADDTNDAADVFVHDRYTGQTQRLSVASDGTEADGRSYPPSISADGRYVAFWSEATNLVGGDVNGGPDLFVHDRDTRQTERVAYITDSVQANWYGAPSLSADGRYVAFDSQSAYLVSGDTNATPDVFVHDRHTGQTQRVSVGPGGTQASGYSTTPSLSADGRYVAFASNASNLVDDDTNDEEDVFVHDRQTGQTELISFASNGAQGDWGSYAPSLSADGQYVAFASYASTLVGGDASGYLDIFVHDRQTRQTQRVSVASDGSQADYHAASPSISYDGRYVAFDSAAKNLVSDDTNFASDIFVHDRGR